VQPKLGFVGYLRFFWRQLTSMRTALFLLLLLAIAAIPGSLVPQVSSDPNGVIQYKAENPGLVDELVELLSGFSLQELEPVGAFILPYAEARRQGPGSGCRVRNDHLRAFSRGQAAGDAKGVHRALGEVGAHQDRLEAAHGFGVWYAQHRTRSVAYRLLGDPTQYVLRKSCLARGSQHDEIAPACLGVLDDGPGG
jgi:hypothetical protein